MAPAPNTAAPSRRWPPSCLLPDLRRPVFRPDPFSLLTMADTLTRIESRDNPWLKDLRRLAQDATGYRRQGRVWLEGDHLCRALLARGGRPEAAVYAQSLWEQNGALDLGAAPVRTVILPDALFQSISGLESPARMGFVMPLPAAPFTPVPAFHTAILRGGGVTWGNLQSGRSVRWRSSR